MPQGCISGFAAPQNALKITADIESCRQTLRNHMFDAGFSAAC
jgi:hypothetical protein